MNVRLKELGTTQVSSERWQAELCVDLAVRAGKTRPVHVSHYGPLRIQRPFYPDADGACHLILLHPPGGVVGGDELDVEVRLAEDARALLTTPAATKLYRSAGARSELTQTLLAKNGSLSQWLPQETIAFAGARARVKTRIHLEEDAHFIGWEVVCLGRPTIGEVFDRGALTLELELYRDGVPLYLDRMMVGTGVDARSEPWGLRSEPVVGTLLVTGECDNFSATLREEGGDEFASRFSVTDMEGVTVVRYLGPSVRDCWAGFVRTWKSARKSLGYPIIAEPRIWSC